MYVCTIASKDIRFKNMTTTVSLHIWQVTFPQQPCATTDLPKLSKSITFKDWLEHVFYVCDAMFPLSNQECQTTDAIITVIKHNIQIHEATQRHSTCPDGKSLTCAVPIASTVDHLLHLTPVMQLQQLDDVCCQGMCYPRWTHKNTIVNWRHTRMCKSNYFSS